MFTTQFTVKPGKREHSTHDTLVSLVPCQTNQERITQALLTGSLVQAANVGFDYKHDEEIQDIMFNVEKRNIDIIDRLEGVQIVRQKVDAYIKGKLHADTEKKINRW